MKLFECQNCGQLLYFENYVCQKCGSPLGYFSGEAALLSLNYDDQGLLHPLRSPQQTYRYCANAQYDACNWLIPAEQSNLLCDACDLNQTIPNLDIEEYQQYWQKLELAKHRLVYSLLRLNMPVVSKNNDSENGIAFDFLADSPPQAQDSGQVLTGHDHGLITINIAEADDAKREKFRLDMREPYRTLLGHFRHEIGHYYWDRLINTDSNHLAAFRQLFGDEQQDYAQALQQHYANPRQDWQTAFVSVYASSHPWEDWAETWAHYLHIIDTLETAFAFGMQLRPRAGRDGGLEADMSIDPYRQTDFERVIETWLPLTYAVNSLNRSMGEADFYPFVLTQPVIDKLNFIHTIIRQGAPG
jgi:hypothetical protein